MDHAGGIAVSLDQSSVCVVDGGERIVRAAQVASEPAALAQFLKALALPLARIGLEAGALSPWLDAGFAASGFAAVLRETRHVKVALSAMVMKTDRRDARGIAQLLSLRGLRRGFGRKLGEVSQGQLAPRVRDLAAGPPLLEPIAAAMVRARAGLREEFGTLRRARSAML